LNGAVKKNPIYCYTQNINAGNQKTTGTIVCITDKHHEITSITVIMCSYQQQTTFNIKQIKAAIPTSKQQNDYVIGKTNCFCITDSSEVNAQIIQ